MPETVFPAPKPKLTNPAYLGLLLIGFISAIVGFLFFGAQPLLFGIFIIFGLIAFVYPLSVVAQGITCVVTSDGLLIRRPIAHERFFPFSAIISVEKITAERAAEIVKEKYQNVEMAKYRSTVLRTPAASFEVHVRNMHATYLQIYHSRPMAPIITGARETRIGGLVQRIEYIPGTVTVVPSDKSDCVLLTVKWKDEHWLATARNLVKAATIGAIEVPHIAVEDEPMALLLSPERPDEFIAAIKQRLPKRTRMDS